MRIRWSVRERGQVSELERVRAGRSEDSGWWESRNRRRVARTVEDARTEGKEESREARSSTMCGCL